MHPGYLLLILALLSGCAAQPRQYPAPSALTYEQVTLDGYHNIRYWGDKPAPYLDDSIERLRRALDTIPSLQQRIDILALSGGAEDGAYGAGFLKGWSESGTRPEFLMVTGVSTGALIAPFAFLGPEYDDILEQFYTETSTADILFFTPLAALFGGEAIADSAPLRRAIKKAINEELVEAIARESRKGRILQVATTNLDAQRPMIWEINRIAESDHPDKVDLIRKIILASASIPGVFPPVKINVEYEGRRHQEVHVDGGVTQQIFVYTRKLDVSRFRRLMTTQPESNFWLIRNTKTAPDYRAVELGVGELSNRAISTLIKYQAKGNLINIENLAKRDGFTMHVTAVPAEFDEPLDDMFDKKYMRALFKVGYEQGKRNAWRKGL